MESDISINSLMASLSFWEIAGYVSLFFVAIGVAGEFTHDFVPVLRRKWAWWDKWGGKVSGLMLIAALAAELVTQVKTNGTNAQIVALLGNDAAKANERTAEIMKTTAWRNLTPNQRIILQKMFLAHPIAGIEMSTVQGDPEAILFCNDIMTALNEVGAKIRNCDTVWELAVGVRIPPFNDPERERLKEDLSAAGLDPIDDNGSGEWRGKKLEIIVGSKLPPSPSRTSRE